MHREYCHGYMTAHSVRKNNNKPVANKKDDEPAGHGYYIVRHGHVASYCDKCGRDFCDATRQTTHRKRKGSRPKQNNRMYNDTIAEGIDLFNDF